MTTADSARRASGARPESAPSRPYGRSCPSFPRAASSTPVTWMSYSASRCTRMSPGSGPRSPSLSSAGPSAGSRAASPRSAPGLAGCRARRACRSALCLACRGRPAAVVALAAARRLGVDARGRSRPHLSGPHTISGNRAEVRWALSAASGRRPLDTTLAVVRSARPRGRPPRRLRRRYRRRPGWLRRRGRTDGSR